MIPLRSLDWDRCYSINAIQLINDIDKGIEDIPNNFANGTTLNGAVDTPEGWMDAVQRALEELKKETHGNLIRFSLQYQYRLRDEQNKRSPAKKDLGILVEGRMDMTWQCELAAQKAN
ncbi:hypothetical protein TURU_157372 [Turdus rufiventris]|nr:hypothetical protein TURU_157372 [Turdus rufiventris]